MSKRICDTALTIDEVETAINRRLNTSAKIIEWSAEDIGTGKGFLSVMARIKMSWDRPDEKLPKSVVVKLTSLKKLHVFADSTPGMENMLENFVTILPKIHNVEVSVFEEFAKLENPPVPTPFMYGCTRMMDGAGGDATESSYIIMEDLSEVGGVVNMIGCERLTHQQHEQLMQAYARLHSWSLTKGDVSKFELLDLETMGDLMMDSIDQLNDGTRELFKTEEWQMKLGVLRDHTEEGMMSKLEFMDLCKYNLKHGIPNTLCHGDVHTNNMLFKKDNEGKSSGDLMVLLDWQIANLGSPISDIVRPMVLNCDRVNRTDEWRNKLLDVYYDEFEKCMDGKTPFTRDQMRACAKESYVTTCKMFLSFFVGMVKSVRAGHIPNIDPEKSANQLADDLMAMLADVVLVNKGVHA